MLYRWGLNDLLNDLNDLLKAHAFHCDGAWALMWNWQQCCWWAAMTVFGMCSCNWLAGLKPSFIKELNSSPPKKNNAVDGRFTEVVHRYLFLIYCFKTSSIWQPSVRSCIGSAQTAQFLQWFLLTWFESTREGCLSNNCSICMLVLASIFSLWWVDWLIWRRVTNNMAYLSIGDHLTFKGLTPSVYPTMFKYSRLPVWLQGSKNSQPEVILL